MQIRWGNSRRILAVGLVLIAALAVRLAYLAYSGGTIAYDPDSQGYYVPVNWFAKDFLPIFFNQYRTPGYRLITNTVMLLTGNSFPQYASSEFYTRTFPIFYVQTAAGILGLLFLYATLTNLGIRRSVSLAFTAFTAFNIYQFLWERAYLTEAIYIFLVAVTMWLFVKLLRKPGWISGILFVAVSAFGFLVRPGGVGFPLILLPLVWLMNRTKKTCILIVLLLCIYVSVPVGYVSMNYYLHRYPGVSVNTDFAVFGRLLKYDIPLEAARRAEPVLFEKIRNYRESGGNTSIPWYFFTADNNMIYGNIGSLRNLNSIVIRNQAPEFLRSIIRDIPRGFTDTELSPVLTGDNPDLRMMKPFFDALTLVIILLQQTTIIFLVLFPMAVILVYRKPTVLTVFLLGIALLEVYQLISSIVFGGAWEFYRHMIVTQSYLFFFCFWWIWYMISAIRGLWSVRNR
jgi:hypothetical protein